MVPKDGRRIRFRPWAYIRIGIASAIGLLSLLITNQVIWSAFADLSRQWAGSLVWLKPDSNLTALDANRWKSASQEIQLQFVAKPLANIEVVHDDSISLLRASRYGRAVAPLDLHRGVNRIELRSADVSGGRYYESFRLIEYSEQKRPKPRFLWASPLQTGGTILLGFAEPDTRLNFNGPIRFSDAADISGLFGTVLDVRAATPGANQTAVSVSYPGSNQPTETDTVELAGAGPWYFHQDTSAFRRKLEIALKGGSYRIRGTAKLGADTAMYQQAENGIFNSLQLLRLVFGVCFDSGEQATTRLDAASCSDEYTASGGAGHPVTSNGEVEFEAAGTFKSQSVQIRLESRSLLASTFLRLPTDELEVTLEDGDLRANMPPNARSEGPYRWTGGSRPILGRDNRELATVIFPAPAAAVSPEASRPAENTAEPEESPTISQQAGSMIARIRVLEGVVPEAIRRSLNTLLGAVPLAGILIILKRFASARAPRIRVLRAVVCTILSIHIAVLALSIFEASFGGWLADLARDLLQDTSILVRLSRISQELMGDNALGFRITRTLEGLQLTYPFLAIATALLVRPMYRAFLREGPPSRGIAIRLLRGFCWLLFWAIVFGAPVAAMCVRVLSMNQTGQVAPWGLAAMLAGAMACVWFVMYWLMARILRIPIRVRDAVVVGVTMQLVPLFPPLTDAAMGELRLVAVKGLGLYPPFLPDRAAPYVWTALVTLLASILLWQVGFLVVRMAPDRSAWRWLRGKPALAVFAPLVVVAYPAMGAMGASVFTLSGFLYRIDSILIFSTILGILTLTRVLNPHDDFAIPGGVLGLGALAFAVFLCGGGTLLFIPIPLILGWYIFRRWLILPLPAPGGSQPGAVRAFIEERRASTTLEDVQKGLNKKLIQGDIKLSEYLSKVGEARQAATYAKAALLNATGDLAPKILGFGAEAGPWENARVAVAYGSVIALPFILITLTSTLGFTASDFPVLDLVYALLTSATTWILAAAIFGYFYRNIRGANGFQKALSFTLAMVVPTLPLRVLSGEELLQPRPLVGILQTATFLLVLALTAFDLRALQKQRFGWRELITAYGFASAAYGSTIAIATAIALWGKQAAPFFESLFKWLGR